VRAALEVDDLLSDEADDDAGRTLRTAPTSMPPMPSAEDISDAATQLRDPPVAPSSLTGPPAAPEREASGSLFAPPAPDLVREDLVVEPAVSQRRPGSGGISRWRLSVLQRVPCSSRLLCYWLAGSERTQYFALDRTP
jgi:hypothetical protein